MCVHQKHHEVLSLLHGQDPEYLWAQGLRLTEHPKDNPRVVDTCSVSCSPAAQHAADGLNALCSAWYGMCELLLQLYTEVVQLTLSANMSKGLICISMLHEAMTTMCLTVRVRYYMGVPQCSGAHIFCALTKRVAISLKLLMKS